MMAPDRKTVERMLREAAPRAIEKLTGLVNYGNAEQQIEAAEALLRCLALFPDPYAQPPDLRRALDE